MLASNEIADWLEKLGTCMRSAPCPEPLKFIGSSQS
jgi:hypothetical protein